MVRNSQEVNISMAGGVQDFMTVSVVHYETEEEIQTFRGKNIPIPDVDDAVEVGYLKTSGKEPEDATTEVDRRGEDYRVVDRVFSLWDHTIQTDDFDKELVSSDVVVYVLPGEEYKDLEG